MAKSPEVSVVASIYNDAESLHGMLESVLSQEGVELELVIVNDGSSDESTEILSQCAIRDRRVTVIEQENKGLTEALIAGCKAAKGRFIARQDCGDVSLPGRLAAQRDLLSSSDDIAFVSCGTRFVGPRGELLYEVMPDSQQVTQALSDLDPDYIRGPAGHGSVMFRRSAYERVGGYRREFYFAQDLDLWIRLSEVGEYQVVPQFLFQVCMDVNSISGKHRPQQQKLKLLAVDSARARRSGQSDFAVLQEAATIRPSVKRAGSRRERAKAYYFIGSCLHLRDNEAAASYFKEAVRNNPLHLRSWFRLVTNSLV